jgi:hypothetical protein
MAGMSSDFHGTLEKRCCCAAESDAEALSWCREWVSGLQAFVMNLDHQVRCHLACDRLVRRYQGVSEGTC